MQTRDLKDDGVVKGHVDVTLDDLPAFTSPGNGFPFSKFAKSAFGNCGPRTFESLMSRKLRCGDTATPS